MQPCILSDPIYSWDMGFHDSRKPGGGVKNTLIGMHKNNNKGRREGRKEGRKAGRQEGRKAGRQEGRKAGRQGGREAGREGGKEGRREGGKAGRMKIDENHREIDEHHRNCEPQVRQIAKNSAPGSHFFRPLTKELFPNDAAPGISAKLTATFSSW